MTSDVRCVLRIHLLGMWDARQKHVRGGTFSINLKFMLKEWRSHKLWSYEKRFARCNVTVLP